MTIKDEASPIIANGAANPQQLGIMYILAKKKIRGEVDFSYHIQQQYWTTTQSFETLLIAVRKSLDIWGINIAGQEARISQYADVATFFSSWFLHRCRACSLCWTSSPVFLAYAWKTHLLLPWIYQDSPSGIWNTWASGCRGVISFFSTGQKLLTGVVRFARRNQQSWLSPKAKAPSWATFSVNLLTFLLAITLLSTQEGRKIMSLSIRET